MASQYLGLDLSTQQLKGIIITSDLKLLHEAAVDFDTHFSTKYGIHKGVLSHAELGEVFAPPTMWMEALDLLLAQLRRAGADLSRVVGVCGAGMQHGTVFWSGEAEALLAGLGPGRTLAEQLGPALAHPNSPNWQDASTQAECEAFEAGVGGAEELARITGSRAHHRFSGPQILRFRTRHPADWAATSRVSLVSSFLASLFLGAIAPIDISDAGGTNLLSVSTGTWDPTLLALAAGSPSAATSLAARLGPICTSARRPLGTISPYFCARYGFPPSCAVAPFTGDNPATMLALPLRPGDAILSLGTSTTFLMSTPTYAPDPAYHFMPHPTTAGLYMFMLCYKNGALARERIRDALNASPTEPTSTTTNPWTNFETTILSNPPLGRRAGPNDAAKLGLFFPRPEIVPAAPAGEWRFLLDARTGNLTQVDAVPDDNNGATDTREADTWRTPRDDARAMVESQLLSCRLRSRALFASSPTTPAAPPAIPAQPRRIYLVGGGSASLALAQLAGEVLGGAEGVYRLDVGGNACALGAAYKAVYAAAGQGTEDGGIGAGETFEEFVGKRWREEEFVEQVDIGYRRGVWEGYGDVLDGFEEMEGLVLREAGRGREGKDEMGSALTRER